MQLMLVAICRPCFIVKHIVKRTCHRLGADADRGGPQGQGQHEQCMSCSILFYPVLLCGFFLSFLCSFSLFFLFLFVSLPVGVDPEQRLFESFAEGPHHRGPQELEHRGGEVTSVTTGTSVVRSTISTDFGRLRYTSKTEIWQMYGRCMMSMV